MPGTASSCRATAVCRPDRCLPLSLRAYPASATLQAHREPSPADRPGTTRFGHCSGEEISRLYRHRRPAIVSGGGVRSLRVRGRTGQHSQLLAGPRETRMGRLLHPQPLVSTRSRTASSRRAVRSRLTSPPNDTLVSVVPPFHRPRTLGETCRSMLGSCEHVVVDRALEQEPIPSALCRSNLSIVVPVRSARPHPALRPVGPVARPRRLGRERLRRLHEESRAAPGSLRADAMLA